MSRERSLPASAHVYGHEPAELEATVVEYGRGERIRRAIRTGGPWLVGAIVSIPIPGWHFVGVPGCGIAAILLGVRKLRETGELVGIRGPCPACRYEQTLAAPIALPAAVTLACPSCKEFSRIDGLLPGE